MKDTLTAVTLGVLISAALAAATALAVMGVLTAWHAYNPAAPALGFIDCLFVVWLTSVLTVTGAAVTRR
ncbi:hypothetical protein [Streptomyces subrutilus]|uniref:hypothetical protein n=1 Tax=Streptomyces subrutilus TaxID=36818 RepID=UPI00340ED9D9